MYGPGINKQLCTGCGKCVRICPVGAFSLVTGKAQLDETRCLNCKYCVSECVKKAISF